MLGIRTLVVPLLGFMWFKALAPILQFCSISFSTTVGLNEVSCSRISDVSGKMRNLLYKIWIWVEIECWSESLNLFYWWISSCAVIFQVLAQIWEGPILKDELLNNFWLESEGLWSQVFKTFCDCGGHFCRCMHRERSVCVDPRFTYLSCSKDVPESPWRICLEFESTSFLPAIAVCSYWGGPWHTGSHICAGFWSKRVVLVLKLVKGTI